jgi:glycosyltransferase involved in cell wall biosynthesis
VTKLSVVLPCLNAADTIRLQLDAMAAQEWSEPWELIVADNGSTDDTRAIVAEYSGRIPGLRVVDASRKPGPAYALNEGSSAARGASLVFCDADDEVAPGWIRAMGEALERHELVACRQEVDKLNEPWVRESRGGSLLVDEVRLRLPFPPFLRHAPSSGLGVRRSRHEEIGGFDESLLANYDTDYCIRLHRLGVEPVLVPGALLHYRYRDELRAIFAQARLYAETSALLQKRYATGRTVAGWRWPLKHWRPVVQELLRARRRGSRARLAWLLGWQVGRFVGSARHRVLAI